jgi:hypothetical protein
MLRKDEVWRKKRSSQQGLLGGSYYRTSSGKSLLGRRPSVSSPTAGTPRIGCVLNGIVRRHLEQRGWRLSTLNIRQRVSGLAHASIATLGQNWYLQIRRVPGFACRYDGLCIPHRSCGNRVGCTFTLRVHAANTLCAQVICGYIGRILRSKSAFARESFAAVIR